MSPSKDGNNGKLGGIFCQRSSAGRVSKACIRSSDDLPARPRASIKCWYVASATDSGSGLSNKMVPPRLKHRFIRGFLDSRSMVTDTVAMSPRSHLELRQHSQPPALSPTVVISSGLPPNPPMNFRTHSSAVLWSRRPLFAL